MPRPAALAPSVVKGQSPIKSISNFKVVISFCTL